MDIPSRIKLILDNEEKFLLTNNEEAGRFLQRLRNEVAIILKRNDFSMVDSNHGEVNENNVYSTPFNAIYIEYGGKVFISEGYYTANPSTEILQVGANLQHTWKSAICELVDNGIQYTLPMKYYQIPREIDIVINSEKSFCTVKDNGMVST